MTLRTTALVFTDAAATALLQELYSYDPRNGVIVYLGPEPVHKNASRLPRRIDEDKVCTFIIPTRTHVPHPHDPGFKIPVNLKRDFNRTIDASARVFEPMPARPRHIAWRLAHPHDPFPKDLYRHRDANRNFRDLKLSSYTIDKAESQLGRPVGPPRKTHIKHPLADKYVEPATRDPRVIDALEPYMMQKFKQDFTGRMEKRVTDLFNDDMANDLLVAAAARNPSVRALIQDDMRQTLNNEMRHILMRLFDLHPPLKDAWAEARRVEQESTLKPTQDHHED